ncbi:MAG: helix-turn-helix domain-containing protein [Desulfobacteraceae bacterium]|nr:helix-turn-helix domain-containing protein [Desulfobacteraceae bacterium]
MDTSLKDELGRTLTTKDVAALLGVDPRTVKRYASELGGVRIGPRLILFFENSLRRLIDANKNEQERQDPVARSREDFRQNSCNQMVWQRPGTKTGRHSLGSGTKKDSQGKADPADPHGLLDGL